MLVSKSYQHSDQENLSLLAKMATVKSAEPGNNSFGINHIIMVRPSPKSTVLNRSYVTQSKTLKTCLKIALVTC